MLRCVTFITPCLKAFCLSHLFLNAWLMYELTDLIFPYPIIWVMWYFHFALFHVLTIEAKIDVCSEQEHEEGVDGYVGVVDPATKEIPLMMDE